MGSTAYKIISCIWTRMHVTRGQLYTYVSPMCSALAPPRVLIRQNDWSLLRLVCLPRRRIIKRTQEARGTCFWWWGSKSRGPRFEEAPLNSATFRGLEERCELPPQDLWQSHSRNRIRCNFSVKIWQLVATILMIYGWKSTDLCTRKYFFQKIRWAEIPCLTPQVNFRGQFYPLNCGLPRPWLTYLLQTRTWCWKLKHDLLGVKYCTYQDTESIETSSRLKHLSCEPQIFMRFWVWTVVIGWSRLARREID